MLSTKLIMVTGMSGSGKSTTAQNLSKILENNNINHVWMHEEIANHPIREKEFKHGEISNNDDFEINIENLLSNWKRLVNEILNSDNIYVMEGCFFQNIIRYFFEVNYPVTRIIQFYSSLMKVLLPVNPTIIFLYSSNVKITLKQVFPQRGAWWEKLILSDQEGKYFEAKEYEGEDGVYSMWQDYQTLSKQIFRGLSCNKLLMDIVANNWEKYWNKIQEFLEIKNHDNLTEVSFTKEMEKFCGEYSNIENQREKIKIKSNVDGLYCVIFWDYMKLVPISDAKFYFAAFPIEIEFLTVNGKYEIAFIGNYDWDLNGKRFVKD